MGRTRYLAGVLLFGLLGPAAFAQFSNPPNATVPIPGNPVITDLAARDFNGDGQVDVAVLAANGIHFFRNAGGLLVLASTTALGGVTTLGELAVADANRDGLLDLYVGGTGAGVNGFDVFLNNGSGFTFNASYVTTSAAAAASRIRVADFNADGFPDVVVGTTTATEERLGVAMHLGNAASPFYFTAAGASQYVFGLSSPDSAGDTVGAFGVEVGDFDRDGDIDIVGGSVDTDAANPDDGVNPFLNRGAGNSLPPAVFSHELSPVPAATGPLGGTDPFLLLSADFNGDNFPDLAVLDFAGGVINLEFYTNSAGAPPTFIAGPNPLDISTDVLTTVFLRAADVNLDGVLDLVRSDDSNNRMIIYTSPFAALVQTNLPGPDPTSNIRSITMGDIDNDNVPDLIVADNRPGGSSLLIYVNTTAGVVLPVGITTACPLPAGVVGSAYTTTITAGGGTIPRSFLTVGTGLPQGLTFNSITGVISGTPTSQGTFTFILAVIDGSGHVSRSNCSLRILRGTPETGAECFDGADNDSDGLIDTADPDCAGIATTEINCSDAVDNDFDGAVDCADLDCRGNAACGGIRSSNTRGSGGASGWLPCSAVPAFTGFNATGLLALAAALMAIAALRRR